jgi:hypothetical protein
MVRRRQRSRMALAGSLVLLVGVAEPGAHPIHTTFTEIVQEVRTKRLSVTVRGFADDLTTAARTVTPGGTVDSAIVIYLRRKVLINGPANRPVTLGLQGVRRAGDVAWFTFLSDSPVNLDGARLLNSAMTELYADQVNVVQIKAGGRSRTMLFTPGDGVKTIDY